MNCLSLYQVTYVKMIKPFKQRLSVKRRQRSICLIALNIIFSCWHSAITGLYCWENTDLSNVNMLRTLTLANGPGLYCMWYKIEWQIVYQKYTFSFCSDLFFVTFSLVFIISYDYLFYFCFVLYYKQYGYISPRTEHFYKFYFWMHLLCW